MCFYNVSGAIIAGVPGRKVGLAGMAGMASHNYRRFHTMKKIVVSLLVLFFTGAFMLSCSSSSESPGAVFKEMGNQIDELVSVLEKHKTDAAAATLALQGYLDKNGTKLKDLAEKAKQIGQKIKDDPKLQQEVMMHALGMIGKAGKLNNIVRDLTKDPGFNAAWTKYQQLSR